jgi:hypothetical protein
MKRWTDGRRWGASRVGQGGFLLYSEYVTRACSVLMTGRPSKTLPHLPTLGIGPSISHKNRNDIARSWSSRPTRPQ